MAAETKTPVAEAPAPADKPGAPEVPTAAPEGEEKKTDSTAPVSAAKPDAAEASAEKRKAEEVSVEALDAKRLKPTPAASDVLRKQVEYYMSDQNLMYDKFFHDKIKSDPEGWLDMSLILSCNKMKAMRATKEAVFEALKESTLEVRDPPGGTPAVRRPQGKALPELQEKTSASQYQKKKPHAHDGGVIVIVKDVPEEQTWMQVKDTLRAKLPDKVGILFASSVSDKNQCIIAVTPFDGDLQFLDGLALEVGGKTLKSEVCYGDILQQALKVLPKNVRERREKMARARQKERQKPIILADQRFPNVGAVRGRVKTILSSRSDGEELNRECSDYKLIEGLLKFHPRHTEKTKGMTGIKIDQSAQGNSRCFWIIKGEQIEDFSANKCLTALELDPPYTNDAPPKGDSKGAPGDSEEPSPKKAKTEEGKPAEEKPADKKPAEEKPAEKPAEEKPADAKPAEGA